MIHGSTYQPELDQQRLESLLHRVRAFMLSGEWHTLGEIQARCGGSEASCSARLRELRNDFKYRVERRRIGKSGLFEYRLSYDTDSNGNGLLPGLA